VQRHADNPKLAASRPCVGPQGEDWTGAGLNASPESLNKKPRPKMVGVVF
jgi:hypothetical protein